jgi:hypothetical protein
MPKSRKYMKLRECPECGADDLMIWQGDSRPDNPTEIWCASCNFTTEDPHLIDSLWEPDYEAVEYELDRRRY